MSVEEEIGAVLAEIESCWKRHDFGGLRALWDADEPRPIYVAEEAPALTSWQEIDSYMAGTQGLLSRVGHRTHGAIVKELAPDLALAYYDMHWNAEVAKGGLFGGEQIAGDVRVTVLFRKKRQGWRVFHYVEAPLAAMIQMKNAMTGLVDPDF